MTTRHLVGIVTGLMLAALLGMAWSGMPLRPIVIGVGLVVAPGLAVGMLAGIRDPNILAALAVPIGLSVVGLVATTVVYLGAWSTELVALIVVVITISSELLASRERSARAALLVLGLLPGAVILAAALNERAI